ncbi:TATA box binding protein-related factor 2 isoform X1 [Megachile rotundata]|uniref:TATA box binding protein-related factor 2 isoform X1 n=1 Tax=Megachile rotundata TaxID=143995 RepID=UPI0006150BFA|nr:PREDICTED: TATA box-binding protein-like protein 1 isoform X1 [Megachile rotundata]XP_012136987.1 PREDICTED: TATA box-binding protein-like protein 1 isoform X1 [Megachile rotundata]
MATAIQKNGVKPLTNSSINHVEDVNNLDNTDICKEEQDERLFDRQIQPYVDTPEQEPRELDIVINNVVCSFSVRCHLNLREIALNGSNVEYRRESGMITMKLRRPYTTASIWSSGKVTCTGATSEVQAKIAARRFARSLQKLGFKVRFNNYRVVNVLGTCCMPFAIKITSFSLYHKENADYEPELHPGVTYKLKEPKATLKIFSTGSVTVTAPNVAAVQAAIEYIYPLVYEFRKERTAEDELALTTKKRKSGLNKRNRDKFLNDPEYIYDTMFSDEEDEEEEVESDASWD